MDVILTEVWKQVPNLAVLALIVYWFIQDRRNARNGLEQITDTCHKLQRETTETMKKCIDRNTDALDKNNVLQGQVVEALRKINDYKV